MQHFSLPRLPSATRRYGWLVLLWLLGIGPVAAQTVTVGSTAVPVVAPATSSYFYGPIYRSTATSAFNFSRHAHLYTPTELNVPPGAVITQLAWLKSDAGTLTGSNIFTVLLANSAQFTLGTTQTWGSLTTGATPVYTATAQQVTGAAGDYFSVTLSQPFTYTGGNLLVLSDHEKQGTASAVINFVTNPAPGLGLGTAGNTALTNTTALVNTTYGDRRPTLRVTYVPGGPCTAPPTAGTTQASAAAVCAGSPVSFALQGATLGTGQTYQWQVSVNGTTFADIAGATGATYTSGPLAATRTFRARLTCSGQTATSAPATVTVSPASYATLPVAEGFENTWTDGCATRDVPANSWRTNPATGNSAWRRDDDGASAAWTSPTLGAYAPASSQGTRSARFHSYAAGANAVGTFDLYVDLSAAGNKVLQFDYLNTAGNDSLRVQVSADGGTTFGAPLLRLGGSGTGAQGWQAKSVSVTSTSATTVVRFRANVTAPFTSDLGLDNVRLSALSGVPTCATALLPAAGATNVSRATALSWQAGTGVTTGYDVYFGTAATPPLVSPNQPGTGYTPAALLAAATTYYYQVVPRNANGPAGNCGVQSFTTSSVPVYCTPGTANLGGDCGGGTVTQVTVAGAGLNATGLACAAVVTPLGSSAYTSYPAAGSTTGTLLRGLSYPITVSTDGSTILSVWVDFNQNGTFETTEWTQIATTTTANTAVTANLLVPATAVLGPTGLRVRSRLSGNPNGATDACATFFSGETKDFVVTIGPAPACAPPTGLTATNVSATSATLAFGASSGPATSYSIQYGTSGFTPGGPGSTTINTTSLSAPITGLTAGTTYQFYVTKDCGGGTTSQVAGPFTFATLCLAPVYAALPVTESFEGTWLNGCATRDIPASSWRNTPTTGNNSWRRDDDGPSAAWVNPTSYGYTPTGSQGARSARFHSGQASSGLVGTFDLYVNLSAAGAKRLSFDYLNTNGSDSLVVQLSTDGGTTFSRLAGYNQSGTVATGFVPRVLSISSTSATAVVRFRGRADFGTTDIGLDNIVLEAATGCLTPAALAATTTTTTAALSWLTGGTGTYTVVYGPTGFNPTTGGTTVAGLAGPPYTVTGLTPGTTYQFYVTLNCAAGANSGTAGPATFATQILNNEPCGALDLVLSNTCAPLTSTTVGATATPGVAPGSCAGFSTTTPLDVWYKFTTAATGPLSTSVRVRVTGASANTVRAYSGACTGPLAFVACASAANGTTAAPILDLTALTPGTTYYVRVGLYSTFQPAPGPITICATPVPNCPTPAGLGVGAVSGTTAVLTWAVPALVGSTFAVTYGPTGFVPGGAGSTTRSGISAQTTTLTNLLPATAYQFYVVQVCGGFDGSSTQAGPFAFATPLTVPANDEPCGALGLGPAPVAGSNVGATTSFQNGITLPACAPAQQPKDVWFFFAPTGSATTLTLTGTPAGMVRVFSTPNCANGPFASVDCRAAPGSNQNVGPLSLAGLTPGARYYVAVSGYGSADATGAFTLNGSGLATPTATRAQAPASALLVYPNPSATGQLALRLAGPRGPGQLGLLNALGQLVCAAPLANAPEQVLSTRGLPPGIYTLRVAVDGQVLTRKIVLE